MPGRSSPPWSAYVTILPKRFDHKMFRSKYFSHLWHYPKSGQTVHPTPKPLVCTPKSGSNCQVRTVRPRISMACLNLWHLVPLQWPWVKEGKKKRAEILGYAAPHTPPSLAENFLFFCLSLQKLLWNWHIYLCDQIIKFGFKDYAWVTSR